MTTTTLSLSWTQPGSAVDSYTVSYTFTIRRCGSEQMSGSVEISNGNARSVMLDSLEEDSDYSITLTANSRNIQLDSTVVSANTNTAGMYSIIFELVEYHAVHIPQLQLVLHQVSMSMSPET